MSLVSDAPEAPGLRAENRDTASGALDLCDARSGGLSERVGTRLAHHHPGTAALIVGGVLLVGLVALVVGWGIVLTDLLLPGSLKQWDKDMVRWFVDHRSPAWNDVSYVATMLADAITVLAIALAVVAILAFRRMWRLAALLAFGLLLELSIYGAGSALVPRFRPPFHRFEVLTQNTSYPSGHTAAAVVLYFCLAILVTNFTKNRFARALAWTVAAIAPVLVGVSRIYRGMHYPTDIATGYVMGILCVIAAVFIVRVTGVVEQEHEQRKVAA